ncbi:hypothetical protein N7451_008881 [Penicillium sp. IBT 35674x]|nr:hypothetical protein N7451_008881 [Penicillium sp. IBT 35674x]
MKEKKEKKRQGMEWKHFTKDQQNPRPAADCCSCISLGHRMKQECTGYRDVSSLVFRDETTHVIGRAKVAKTLSLASSSQNPVTPVDDAISADFLGSAPAFKARNSRSLKDSDDDNGNDDNEAYVGINDAGESIYMELMQTDHNQAAFKPSWHIHTPSTPSSSSSSSCISVPTTPLLLSPAAPSESLSDLGVKYFFDNYVHQESDPCPGFLDYTMEILHDLEGDTALVEVAVSAVGLAGLANTKGSASTMYKARASYADALQRVNSALANPQMARSNSTIFAVVALGIFETITCTDQKALEAWARHIKGTMNLVIHRGTDQFDTKVGLHMFQEAISHILVLCSRYGQAIPPRIRFLRAEAEAHIPPNDPAWRLSGAHIEAMDLYQRVNPEQTKPFLAEEWEHLLSHAVEVDRRLEVLFGNLPRSWRFKIVDDPCADPRIVHLGTYHVYHDIWVAKIWDGMRACRILLNQVIYSLLVREGLTWAAHELVLDGGVYAGILRKSVATTVAMRDGILASVPQMLGFVRHEVITATSHLNCTGGGEGSHPHQSPALGAFFLLWLLFLAGSLPINTPETRDWVVDRLRAICTMTGIKKARYLADDIEKQPLFSAGVLMTSELCLPFL